MSNVLELLPPVEHLKALHEQRVPDAQVELADLVVGSLAREMLINLARVRLLELPGVLFGDFPLGYGRSVRILSLLGSIVPLELLQKELARQRATVLAGPCLLLV